MLVIIIPFYRKYLETCKLIMKQEHNFSNLASIFFNGITMVREWGSHSSLKKPVLAFISVCVYGGVLQQCLSWAQRIYPIEYTYTF